MSRDYKESVLARYEADGSIEAYTEALALYQQAVANDPGNAELLHHLGYLHELRGRRLLEEAARHYERCIEVAPDWPKGHFQWIQVLASLGMTEKAIERYKREIDAKPDATLGYLCLAACYLKVDQLAEAELVISTALKLAPHDATTRYWAGEVYARLERPDAALEHWHRALAIDPAVVDARYSMAFLFERLGRLEEAAGQWRAIIDFLKKGGFEIEAEWPKRELARIERELAEQAR